jgi:hypothetical protein
MSLMMTLRIAFKALGRNKLRTVLTMLGMIIGVAAVIAMVALGSGAQAQIEEAVKAQGTNLITISPGNMSIGGVRGGAGTSTRFTEADATGDSRDAAGGGRRGDCDGREASSLSTAAPTRAPASKAPTWTAGHSARGRPCMDPSSPKKT